MQNKKIITILSAVLVVGLVFVLGTGLARAQESEAAVLPAAVAEEAAEERVCPATGELCPAAGPLNRAENRLAMAEGARGEGVGEQIRQQRQLRDGSCEGEPVQRQQRQGAHGGRGNRANRATQTPDA